MTIEIRVKIGEMLSFIPTYCYCSQQCHLIEADIFNPVLVNAAIHNG